MRSKCPGKIYQRPSWLFIDMPDTLRVSDYVRLHETYYNVA